MPFSITAIDHSLVSAGRLRYRPIYIYGSDHVPRGAVQVSSVIERGHRCLARAILKQSLDAGIPPVYLGKDALKGCCYGALSWLGFIEFPKSMEAMLTGAGDEEAMFLKSSPAVCRASLKNIGRITPPANYVVASSAADLKGGEAVLSVACFGTAEQVRNLCALVHFDETRIFEPIMAPWGSYCSLIVAYPAGMAANGPKDTAFIGPSAPDGNAWFPEDLMALSMPIGMAGHLSEVYDRSFVVKAPEIAYPKTREPL